eukprot:scaffold6609_cov34-Tisochrysis_lutea.AAC.7
MCRADFDYARLLDGTMATFRLIRRSDGAFARSRRLTANTTIGQDAATHAATHATLVLQRSAHWLVDGER